MFVQPLAVRIAALVDDLTRRDELLTTTAAAGGILDMEAWGPSFVHGTVLDVAAAGAELERGRPDLAPLAASIRRDVAAMAYLAGYIGGAASYGGALRLKDHPYWSTALDGSVADLRRAVEELARAPRRG